MLTFFSELDLGKLNFKRGFSLYHRQSKLSTTRFLSNLNVTGIKKKIIIMLTKNIIENQITINV